MYELHGFAISPDDSYAYLASLEGGIQVLDISNKSTPRLIANVESPSLSTDLETSSSGAFLYSTNGLGGVFQIFDVSMPGGINLISELALEGDHNIWNIEISAEGTQAVLSSVTGNRSIYLISISDPISPFQLARHWDNNRGQISFSQDDKALLVGGGNGLNVYHTGLLDESFNPSVYTFNFDSSLYRSPECGISAIDTTTNILFLGCYSESRLNKQEHLLHLEVFQVNNIHEMLSAGRFEDPFLSIPVLKIGSSYFNLVLVLSDREALDFRIYSYSQITRFESEIYATYMNGILDVPSAYAGSDSYALSFSIINDDPVVLRLLSAD